MLLDLHTDISGAGPPLVLLAGGHMTHELCFGPYRAALDAQHTTIALELQGHGRTPDVDRVPTLVAMADDVIAAVEGLGHERVAILGYSLGAMVAVEVAVRRPDLVDKLVVLSAAFAPDGAVEIDFTSDPPDPRMPRAEDFAEMAAAYRAVAPDPDHQEAFDEKLQPTVQEHRGWTDHQIGGLSMPVLYVLGDQDFTSVEHGERVAELLPHGRLVVLPDHTHMQVGQDGVAIVSAALPFLAP